MTQLSAATENIECPLCLGEGNLKRTEVLDRLGVKDFARVAQLSAEEAIRLLLQKHNHENQSTWARFEAELTKRTAEIEQCHRNELRSLASRTKELEAAAKRSEQQRVHEIQHANRRVEDTLREIGELRERNQELETQLSKTARRGKLEELSFEEEVRTWAGICISEKLPRNGDFILAYRDPSGAPMEPRLLVDNKDKAAITEADIKKLIRDAKERRSPVGIIVARAEAQLRQLDRERRWVHEDGVWILRTTRQWLPRDLEVLKPVFERMRTEGADFLQRNSALAEEVCRTFVDLDEVEKELKKASKAIDAATGLTSRYRARLEVLCDNATAPKMPPVRENAIARIAQ